MSTKNEKISIYSLQRFASLEQGQTMDFGSLLRCESALSRCGLQIRTKIERTNKILKKYQIVNENFTAF